MQEVYKAIGRVAAQDVTVLITGESGTGKELVARAIYQHGPRAKAPFLAMNCAAIPENLLESELFGHEKGAFTGADRRRIGKFEQCHGGTLFLDEIGDMPPACRPSCCACCRSRRSSASAATRRSGRRAADRGHAPRPGGVVEEGKFRPDLYYRLGVFTIHLPPLASGATTCRCWCTIICAASAANSGARSRSPPSAGAAAHYPWPGNIRELQSVLKQALLQASGTVLLPAFLPESFAGLAKTPLPSAVGRRAGLEVTFVHPSARRAATSATFTQSAHRHSDWLLLPRVLEHTGGSQHQAALILGIARGYPAA